RHPNDAENAKQNDDGDKDELPPELGTHTGWLSLLGRFGLKSRDGGAGDLDLDLFGNSQLDGVVLQPHDGPVNPAVGDDLVPVLEIPKHFGDLLLAPLLGQDHQEVKNDHYED